MEIAAETPCSNQAAGSARKEIETEKRGEYLTAAARHITLQG
jgi:hypothetical protein